VGDGLDGRAELRLAELAQHIDVAADAIAGQHPESAGDIRLGLRDLRDRLQRVHELCAEIDDRTWSAYTTGFDRGLADLADDLAAGGADAADDAAVAVEDVVYAHAVRLEVDGWVLRLDLAGRDAPVEGRELVAGAAREIDEYHAAIAAGGAPSRTDVERALSELRGAAD
jgi:hypothetical protein